MGIERHSIDFVPEQERQNDAPCGHADEQMLRVCE